MVGQNKVHDRGVVHIDKGRAAAPAGEAASELAGKAASKTEIKGFMRIMVSDPRYTPGGWQALALRKVPVRP